MPKFTYTRTVVEVCTVEADSLEEALLGVFHDEITPVMVDYWEAPKVDYDSLTEVEE